MMPAAVITRRPISAALATAAGCGATARGAYLRTCPLTITVCTLATLAWKTTAWTGLTSGEDCSCAHESTVRSASLPGVIEPIRDGPGLYSVVMGGRFG